MQWTWPNISRFCLEVNPEALSWYEVDSNVEKYEAKKINRVAYDMMYESIEFADREMDR